MDASIQAVHLPRREAAGLCPTKTFGLEQAKTVRAFHATFPEYSPTPLASLPNLARYLGVASIHVKDESFRFGLKAFKVLGGSYAIGRYLGRELGLKEEELSCAVLSDPDLRKKAGPITFATATDGNHGRGVAWPGYQDIPTWIMQGYTTMALEAVEQLDGQRPTHVFLQAGVGAMPGSLTGFFADLYGSDRPVITIVEPHGANCIFRTAQANDGQIHTVSGELNTIMAGLACGEPCSIAWNVLKHHTDHFISMADSTAALGMRVLGAPLPGDPRVISGESGASTLGFVTEVLRNANLAPLREALELDESSRILCFSTEGATDRNNYGRVVWDGSCPSF